MSHRRYQTCGFVGAKNFLGLTAHARTPCKTYERMRPCSQTNHTRRSRRPRLGANAKGPRAKRSIGKEAPKGLAKGRQNAARPLFFWLGARKLLGTLQLQGAQ